MPGRKCILCGKSSLVTNKEGSNTSYFSFPRDENLRKKWIDVCHSKIDNIITARICSDHFKEEDFLHNKNGIEEVRKKRLKCNVVPSLYLEARGKQSRNNVIIKNSNKENSKDCLKKKDSSKDTENMKYQNSVLQSKRKSSSGNKNNKIIKDQMKKKSISENNKYPNLLPKHKNGKELNNKEDSKELTKRKNQLKNISLGMKEISKKKSDLLLKKKSKSLNTMSVKKNLLKHKIAKKSINKENQMEIVEENLDRNALKDISKEKLTRQMITKSTKKELNRKKIHPEMSSKNQKNMKNKSEFPKHEISENNKEEISQEIFETDQTKQEISENTKEEIVQEILDTKVELESISGNVNKKTNKRKSLIANGIPRKMHKKRIRLGKDDSEDSDEDSSYECRKTNMSRDKITYKSPYEMAHNEDLLKYLNYLKEKSRSSDQPILFWVDD